MTTVGSYEAKTHLPRLLDEVARGGVVTITKHGHEIARIVPVGSAAAGEDLVEAFRELRAQVQAGPSVRELIDEGRR